VRAAATLRRVGYLVGLPLVLLVVWWVLTDNSTDPYVVPLREIFATFPDTWTGTRLVEDVLPSVLRLLVGYGLSVLLGVALGVAVGSSRGLRDLLEPVLEFFRAIPPPVIIPIVILFAGIGDTMKIIVIVSGCLWPVLLNTVEGVRAVDEVLSDTSRCYGIRGAARLRHLTLRAASPQIVAGMRQGLSVGIILMVISEMFAARNGLGYFITQSQRGFAIPQMWTGIIVLGLIGFTLAMLLRLFEWRTMRWYRGLRDAQRGGS
jgi:ABC-type nitrate/sulfonate/bicarbonate transport system permease component